jgi:hypothetical protein
MSDDHSWRVVDSESHPSVLQRAADHKESLRRRSAAVLPCRASGTGGKVDADTGYDSMASRAVYLRRRPPDPALVEPLLVAGSAVGSGLGAVLHVRAGRVLTRSKRLQPTNGSERTVFDAV